MNSKKILTLGEIMLRLSSPSRQRLLQTPVLHAVFGGSEANVAVSLANFGLSVDFASVIPDNAPGNACIKELKKHNINTDKIIRCGDRLGIYFLEPGSNQRPSQVTYDRAHSAFYYAPPDRFDWNTVFQDIHWFHISGITPAISEHTLKLTTTAISEAKKRNITISCDLNFRKKLWKYGKTALEIMPQIIREVQVLIANEEDCQKSLGISSSINVDTGKLEIKKFEELSRAVMQQFPNLEKTAVTMRESISADHNNWQSIMRNKDNCFTSNKYEIKDIIDRVGAGDAFAAGLIYGLTNLENDREALEFAAAASCLKHTIPGDFNLVSVNEVNQLLAGNSSGRVQR